MYRELTKFVRECYALTNFNRFTMSNPQGYILAGRYYPSHAGPDHEFTSPHATNKPVPVTVPWNHIHSLYQFCHMYPTLRVADYAMRRKDPAKSSLLMSDHLQSPRLCVPTFGIDKRLSQPRTQFSAMSSLHRYGVYESINNSHLWAP